MAKLSEINLLSIGHSIAQAGALYSGEGKLYLVLFPKEQGKLEVRQTNAAGDHSVFFENAEGPLEVETLDLDAADWETFLRQTDLLEVEGVDRASDGTLAKVILRKSQRTIETGVQWRVFKRDGYKCRYCANDSTPLTVDHLVLWEEGGPSIEQNLVSACRKCNKTRGNKSYADWLKHPHYIKVSEALTVNERVANLDLAKTLDALPRLRHKRSR